MNNTRRLGLMALMSIGSFFSFGIGAEEEGSNEEKLKVADEFKRGDVISADTFNQIFRTIEKINKQAEDDDLVGTWTCNALTTRNTGISGWENKGLFYVLEDAQVNFISSGDNDSKTSPYTVTTSSPSPIRLSEDAFSGNYSLVKNMLFTKLSGNTQSRIFSIDIVSPRKIELVFQETSAQSFPANYASYIDCVAANDVPASPTSPTINQNGTDTLNLAWTDVSSDETGFYVYRRLGDETEYTLLTTLAANTTTYGDTTVKDGVAASYYIQSYNDNGASAKSKVVGDTSDYTHPTVSSTSAYTIASVGGPGGGETTYTQWNLADPIITGDGLRLWSQEGPVFRLDISFGEEVKLSKEFAADKTGLALLINGVEQEFPYWSNQLQSFAAEMQLYVQYKPNASYSVSFNPAKLLKDKAGNEFLQTYEVEFATGDCPTNSVKANGTTICE